jgi:hypothetical protein
MQDEIALVDEVVQLVAAFEGHHQLEAMVYNYLLLNLPVWAAASPKAQIHLMKAVVKLSTARRPPLRAFWHPPLRGLQGAQRLLDQSGLLYRAGDADEDSVIRTQVPTTGDEDANNRPAGAASTPAASFGTPGSGSKAINRSTGACESTEGEGSGEGYLKVVRGADAHVLFAQVSKRTPTQTI